MARRRRRNPLSPSQKLAGLYMGILGTAAVAPLVSGFVFGGPMVPVAGALAGVGYFLNKRKWDGMTAPAAIAKGGLAGLAFAVLYNLRGQSAAVLRGIGPGTG